MPRKRTTILDGFSNPFPTRLRTLLTETKTTQQRLADAIGMKNRQSIGNIVMQEQCPIWKHSQK